MSTKIYDAYRFALKRKPFERLIPMLFEFRKEYVQYKIDMLSRMHWPGTADELYDRIMEETKRPYNTDYNLSSSIMVYFHEGVVYVQFFGVENKFLDPFLKKHRRLFKDFHYQDQTDYPSHITDEEWEHREHVWTALLKGTFSESGLVFPLIGTDTFDILWTIIDTVVHNLGLVSKKDVDNQ